MPPVVGRRRRPRPRPRRRATGGGARPSGPRRRTACRRRGRRARSSSAAHHRADLAGGPDDGDPHATDPTGPVARRAARAPPAGSGVGPGQVRQLEGLVQERARPPRRARPRTTHEMRIERRRDHLDVDAGVGEGLEHGGGHAGMASSCRRPIERHLGDAVVGGDLRRRRSRARALGHLEADVARSSSGTVKEMSVVPCSEVFCTIMSTLTERSARARNRRAAMPGRSGTPVTVTLASEVSWVTAVTIGLLHGRILLDDPGARLPREARADVQRARGGCGRTPPSAAPAPGRRSPRSRASPRSSPGPAGGPRARSAGRR